MINKPIDFNGDKGLVMDMYCSNSSNLDTNFMGQYREYLSLDVYFLDFNGNVICQKSVQDSCGAGSLPSDPDPPGGFPPIKFPDFEGELFIVPNPVTDESIIYFKMNEISLIDITLFNYFGAEVKQLYSGSAGKAAQSLIFESSDMQSGIYYVRISSPSGYYVKPLVIIK